MDKYHMVSFVFGFFFCISIVLFVNFLMQPQPQVIIEEKNPNEAYLDVVSKTEYYANETGQVIVRLSDWKGSPLSATCNATIIFPNKTFWMIDQSLSASSILGNYYMVVTIPDILGVYEYSFDCVVSLHGAPYRLKKSSSFHVSIAYQKFEQILSEIQDLKNLIYNQTGVLNSTIMNKLYKIQEEIASVNNTVIAVNESIQTSLDNKFYTLQFDIQQKYDNIMTAIFNLQQRWLDIANQITNDLIGAGQSLNKIGDTLGISPSATCGLFDRLAGRC